MADTFAKIRQEIIDDPMNAAMRDKGYQPVYTAAATAKIVIIGQAPGAKAQASEVPWSDASGNMLRTWMGVSEQEFYNTDDIALLPMDFYYPGKAAHGDLPPRKGFAEKWHGRLLALMPDIELVILIGAYAQKYYLGKEAKRDLTETVRAYKAYGPKYFPIVHPSPLNFRWIAKNPWFESEVVPALQAEVRQIL